MTNFHTRGYLKIKMSHDEIVGNVLSWLGSWLGDRKQPKPTLLVTHSICSQPPAWRKYRKYGSFLNGKVIRGRPPKDSQIGFYCHVLKERSYNPICPQNAKLRETLRLAWDIFGRIHVIKEVTDEPEHWQWQRAWEENEQACFQEVMSSEVSFTPGQENQDIQFSASVVKYLINIYLEERLEAASWWSRTASAGPHFFPVLLGNSVQPGSCMSAWG